MTIKMYRYAYFYTAPLLKATLLFMGLNAFVPSAMSAVQMGGHMDFVLENGRTVRVFPEATNMAPIRPGNVLPKRQRVNTLPPGGDPCVRLESEYKKRTARRSQLASAVATRPNKKPAWLKKTAQLKSHNFRSVYFLNNKPRAWYYLPSEPRVAMKEGIPEATFVKFVTDETSENGGAEGGLFHLMVTYGLTKAEEKELKEALKKAIPGAVLKGMVDLEPARNSDNFIVTSGTLSDEGFSPTGVLSSGRAPSFAGQKAALAGRLSSLGAQLMEKSFENTTSDLSVTFAYDYIVKTQAYKAEIRIDLDRIQDFKSCALQARDKEVTRHTEGLFKKVDRWLFGGTQKQDKVRISEQNLRQSYDTLISIGAIEIRIDQNLPDAEVSTIESSMMEMAMQAFTNMQQSFATNEELQARKESNLSDAETEGAKQRNQDKARSTDYTYYELQQKQSRQTGVQTFKVEKGVALYRTHSMTGNIGGFIREHKDKIYDEVLLNDTFFKRGVITVDLDGEALDLFAANMVNNAAVEVIVPFPGDPFTDDAVFTRNDISTGGILKKFTYATRGNINPNSNCPYQYVESWSLRGGGKWPTNPRPKCAREMAVTLVPPIKSREISVDSDLAEMEEVGVRAADVLLKYTRYGKEEIQTVPVRVSKGEPYIEQKLFVDKDAQEVDYKVVFTHKNRGKFDTQWQRLEDNYVFINLSGLPMSTLEEIRQKVPEIKSLIDELKSVFE